MNVLVLGGGGREHALAWRLARDESVESVDVAPGNAGTAAVGRSVDDLPILDPRAVVRHAARERYGLVVIGPEAPLAAGVADALRQARIPVFGPDRAAARLESSKAFAKQVMRRTGVPTAEGREFNDREAALSHLRSGEFADRPPVVKADWLAAGKGVLVPETGDQAEAAIEELFSSPGGLRPGATVILEQRLEGREVSAFALIAGERVFPLAAACDYQRVGDADTGPNTGGMGGYAPVPWFGRPQLERVAEEVFEPVAWRMARDSMPYSGVLYAGLIVTDDGPVVLEFNVRFGDPEAQILLPLFEGDLATALLACAAGDLDAAEGQIGWRDAAALGVVIASEGYPEEPLTGRRLEGAEPSSPADDDARLCFHAGTRRAGAGFESSGGRVVTLVGRGGDLATARDEAYAAVADCRLEGGRFRTDIGLRELT